MNHRLAHLESLAMRSWTRQHTVIAIALQPSPQIQHVLHANQGMGTLTRYWRSSAASESRACVAASKPGRGSARNVAIVPPESPGAAEVLSPHYHRLNQNRGSADLWVSSETLVLPSYNLPHAQPLPKLLLLLAQLLPRNSPRSAGLPQCIGQL